MVATAPLRGRGGGGGFRGGRRGGVRGGVQGFRGPCMACRCHLMMQRACSVIKEVVEPHKLHDGVFIAKGKEDALCTRNMIPGEAVYNEKRISVKNEEDGTKTEYRVWNPLRSKLAAAILNGLDNIWIKPGVSVLYHGAASGITVSHVSDIVGPNGVVYAVEFSQKNGSDLANLAKKRTNIIPIVGDARHPDKYRMLVGTVDVIFSDVDQTDQARILAQNASCFLKVGGHFVTSIKADCMDSKEPAEVVFAAEVKRMKVDQFKPVKQVTLEPYKQNQAVVVGGYRMPKKLSILPNNNI